MGSLTFILLPIILGSIGAYLLFKPTLKQIPKTRRFSVQLSKSTHFKMLIGFMALLVLLTIVAEFVASGKPLVTPPPKADLNFEEEVWEVSNQIMDSEKIDDALLLEKRIHPAGDALVIQHSPEPYDDPHIYIERRRKNNNEDQTIEEILYKPAVLVDNYDFSDRLKIVTPVWDGNIVSFPQVKSKINFTTFEEATALKQLTASSSQQLISEGGFSTYRPLIIHLIVPKDLEIIADEDFISFIDEYE